MSSRRSTIWTFAITSIALFMVALDNLVVTTALPVIRADLGASLTDLEWMVNAYTLTFAVLLLTGAALGDRFGRRRLFVIGLTIFTAGSAAAALAPSSDVLILARAIQGVGGAIVTPLSLTILSAAVPPERRAVALGAWGGIAGLAIAIGPLVGGAIAEGVSWHWIFWLNVPIGIVAVALSSFRLQESRGPDGALDLPGLGLVSAGLLALVWGVIHGNDRGWTDPQIVGALAIGAALLAGFLAWESRTRSPMLPLRFFRSRAFSAANVVSFLMYFGVFGAVFLLVQFFQIVQGLSPFQSGLRTLPWTAMPAFVAPIAGLLAGRIGGRPILVAGMILLSAGLAWIAAVATPTVEYLLLVPGFVFAGIGMGLFFAPIANVVLSAVEPIEEGQASGATNTIREIGGVFGVAVLASVFSSSGSYASPTQFVDGLVPAVWVGAAIVAVGAVVALALPGRVRRAEAFAAAWPRRRRHPRVCPRRRPADLSTNGRVRRDAPARPFVLSEGRFHPAAADRRVGGVAGSRGATQLDEHPVGGRGLGIGQRSVAARARPADREVEGDGPRLEPQLARTPDPLDVIDREDLVGLGHQHREPAGPEAGDVIGLARAAPEGVGDRGHDPVDRTGPHPFGELVEALQLDHDDRGGAMVPADARILVGNDPGPGARHEQTGQAVGRRVGRRGRGGEPIRAAHGRRAIHAVDPMIISPVQRRRSIGARPGSDRRTHRWRQVRLATLRARPQQGEDDDDDVGRQDGREDAEERVLR